LAIALAQAGNKVLLIDADLRKPTQHKIFEVNPQLGLGSVLTDRRPVDEAIIPEVAGRLDLLPCGKCPTNPVELLNNEYFAEMIQSLKSKYDRIVLDSPPIMPVADARVISAMSDATILVLRAEKSTRRVSVAARNELWGVRAKRLGVVVNGVPTQKHGSYYGYGYGEEYGYGSYGEATSPSKTPRRARRVSQGVSAQEITLEETADA
jgi:succinoglycan biosynthesis transport protein ExoP